MLFRLAAVGEAIGWTLLITGIGISHYITPGNNDAVDIAGRMHGTLFLIYITSVAVLAPSLKWSPAKIVIGALCSVPPYGSLAFEMWVVRQQKNHGSLQLTHLAAYWLLSS